ncbi:hypothetical protein ABZ883_12355 [Streptomyces sp. NPDC046977]|uniref:hypothetical protein n=1 Tax=Streptomyces sp. NPDC046977 TaxID=3154703 RepID=UPI0033D094A0
MVKDHVPGVLAGVSEAQDAERASTSAPVHLVPPSPARPDRPAGAFGPVEVLPAVACIGVFRSTVVDPGLDPVLHRSVLTVAWFQPLSVVPAGEDADPALREVRWEELARDYEL